MNSQWNDGNKFDDLCNNDESAPINIYNGFNTKTPECYVFEDELEEIGSSTGDFQTGQDLDFINEMLHLVQDANSLTEISDTDAVIEMSKFMTTQQNSSQGNVASDKDIEKLLKKKKKNVAIESILQGISNECNLLSLQDNVIGYKNEQVKLLKPEDFVLKSESSLETEASEFLPIKGLITEASAFVFKKNSPELPIQDDSPKTEVKSDAYQPSCMAELYYKKYLERSKFKERMQQSTEEFYEKINKNEDVKAVQLPYHRHKVSPDCIVCNIICRKFFE